MVRLSTHCFITTKVIKEVGRCLHQGSAHIFRCMLIQENSCRDLCWLSNMNNLFGIPLVSLANSSMLLTGSPLQLGLNTRTLIPAFLLSPSVFASGIQGQVIFSSATRTISSRALYTAVENIIESFCFDNSSKFSANGLSWDGERHEKESSPK